MNTAIFAEVDAAIATASPADRPALVVALAARLATVGAGLTPTAQEAPLPATENVSIEEGSRRLGMSTSYLYRHAKKLPFIVREGRRRLVNLAALDRYNRQNGGR